MKRLTLALLAAAVLMVVASATIGAQDQPTRLVFVDAQALIAAHPGGQAANELRAQASSEIGELRTQLDALQARARAGEALRADEQERFNILLTTLDAVQTRYQADIAAAAQPAIEAVNDAIRDVSLEREYTIVMDIAAAAENGLVVYAADGLDITDVVLARLR
jgi:outer membrane protein